MEKEDMKQRLRAHIDGLFQDTPPSMKTVEVKEEILQNLLDKYGDLINEGKSEEAAYNIAVASVGDISELLEELKRHGERNGVPPEVVLKERKKNALFTAVGVALIFVSAIPMILLKDITGIVAMFAIFAAAVGILVYSSMTKPAYLKDRETIADELRSYRESQKYRKRIFGSIISAMWCLTVVFYMFISFATNRWEITWVIFLIAAALTNIIKALFDPKR